jgi:hypothetical protein
MLCHRGGNVSEGFDLARFVNCQSFFLNKILIIYTYIDMYTCIKKYLYNFYKKNSGSKRILPFISKNEPGPQ